VHPRGLAAELHAIDGDQGPVGRLSPRARDLLQDGRGLSLQRRGQLPGRSQGLVGSDGGPALGAADRGTEVARGQEHAPGVEVELHLAVHEGDPVDGRVVGEVPRAQPGPGAARTQPHGGGGAELRAAQLQEGLGARQRLGLAG
jgi:hypothetical protein